VSPRAAGDDPYYSFYLNGDRDGPAIRLPSVTSILKRVLSKPALVPWAYKLGTDGGPSPTEILDVRSDQGRRSHAYFEARANGVPMEEGVSLADIKGWLTAIADWFLEPRVFHATEVTVFSLDHRYAGQLDAILETDEGLQLIDLKTRNKNARGAYESDLMQVAGYKLAYEEMTGVPIAKTGVLIAREDGKYKFDERQVDPSLFLSALDLYRKLEEEGL